MRPLALLLAGLALLACSREAPAGKTPVRIMPLGDSITEAEGGRASYRYWLWRALEERGLPADFVGSRRGGHRGTPRFDDFDADHEGHWGFTTAQVLAGLDAWAASAPADVVLLHLGTNDLARGRRDVVANLERIVEILRRHSPGVSVLVARLVPAFGLEPRIEELNREIDALARRLDRPGARVISVDQHAGFDLLADSYDRIHPDESGERKMAERWLEALLALDPWNAGGADR